MSQSAEILKEQFSKSLGLPWQDILPASRLNQILEEERIAYRSRLYTPVVTLWAMIHQVFPRDAQCVHHKGSEALLLVHFRN